MSKEFRPKSTGGRKPGQKNRYSVATISRELMEAFHASLYVGMDPIAYCVQLRKKQPAKYADLFGIAMKRAEAEQAIEAVYNIVKLTADGARPTPGVLASPIAANVAPQRHLRLVDEVVTDVE